MMKREGFKPRKNTLNRSDEVGNERVNGGSKRETKE
jgi:hypothetical protein